MQDFRSDLELNAALSGDGIIRKLEGRFSELLKKRLHCLSVVNATSGLAAVLGCLPRGRVITTLFTSPATLASIKHAGHDITFCDIDPVSLCLSPACAQRSLDCDVRAIVTVNIFGHKSQLTPLRELADKVNALLIVDAAQSLATCLSNPEFTSIADVTIFSLGPNKWLRCADGGLIAVRKRHLWEELVLNTQHEYRQILDVPARAPNFDHFNYRINPYTAGQAFTALENIVKDITHVRQEQHELIEQLKNILVVEPLPVDDDIIFEPLTVLPRHFGNHNSILHDLPLPRRTELARKNHLPETLRQFLHRKVIKLRD